MENPYDYSDEYSYIVLKGRACGIISRAEAAICGNETFLLEEVLEDLKEVIIEIETLEALTTYDVRYYKLQFDALKTSKLKEQYLLNKVKLSLITSKLNYLRSIEDTIDAILNKNIEMQLK